MKFIHDYRQFIEVGCLLCGKKHTVQLDKYAVVSGEFQFKTPMTCTCGHVAHKAIKDNQTSDIIFEDNDMMKRNKATTVKILLVMGFMILFFSGEVFYMLSTKEAEPKSAHHEVQKETSSTAVNDIRKKIMDHV